jgi:hypothetical protein
MRYDYMNSPERVKIDLRNAKFDVETERMGCRIDNYDAFHEWRTEMLVVSLLCMPMFFLLGYAFGGGF